MGASQSNRSEGFTTCKSATASDRPYTFSPDRCYSSWVTADICPAGYTNLGGTQTLSKSATYCAGDTIFSDTNRYRGYCYKSAYPMDDESLVKCCLGNTSEEQCDPSYCVQSAACFTKMKEYCNKGNNYANENCKAWYKLEPNNEDLIMKSKCTAYNIKNMPACREYAQKHPGSFDQVMPDYCASNPTDSLCTCIHSALNKDGGVTAPPACFDNKCINTGYRTLAMHDATRHGCNYVNCNAVINANDRSLLTNVKIEQQCGTQIKKIDEESERLRADQEKKTLAEQEERDAEQAAADMEWRAQQYVFYKLAGDTWVNYYSNNQDTVERWDKILSGPITNVIPFNLPDPVNAIVEQVMVKYVILILVLCIMLAILYRWSTKKKQPMYRQPQYQQQPRYQPQYQQQPSYQQGYQQPPPPPPIIMDRIGAY